jgi:hypothetical protein
MKTEGPQTEQETREGRPKSNVVRLPRDWLGPREELVPFGAEASDAGEADLAEDELGPAAARLQQRRGNPTGAPERDRPRLRSLDHNSAPPEAPVPQADGLVSPPSASDFWSEHSEVIHDALQGPTPTIIEPQRGDAGERPEQSAAAAIHSVVPAGPAIRPQRGPTKERGRWRRWAHNVSGPSASVRGQSASGRGSPAASDVAERSRRRPEARTMRVAVGAVGVAAVVVAMVMSITGSMQHAPRTLSSASQTIGLVNTTGLQLRFDRLLATISEVGTTRREASAHRPHAIRQRPHARRPVKPLARTNPAPGPAPSYRAPTYSLPASTYNSPTNNGGSSSSSGSSAGSGSSSGGGGGGSTAPAGPVGPGAPFGPGHLG